MRYDPNYREMMLKFARRNANQCKYCGLLAFVILVPLGVYFSIMSLLFAGLTGLFFGLFFNIILRIQIDLMLSFEAVNRQLKQ